jgi:hypothetical protein
MNVFEAKTSASERKRFFFTCPNYARSGFSLSRDFIKASFSYHVDGNHLGDYGHLTIPRPLD